MVATDQWSSLRVAHGDDVKLSHLMRVGAVLGILPYGVVPTRMWANDYGSREPRTVTDADRERIARAEAKRARKAAKRGAP